MIMIRKVIFEGIFREMFPYIKNGHFKNVQNRFPFSLFGKFLLLKITTEKY